MKEHLPTSRSGFSPPNALRFGGGGRTAAPSTPSITQVAAPAVSPAATASSAEVVQSQLDVRRQALKKRGFSRTVFAGDDGGWFGGRNTTPGPTNPKGDAASAGPGAKTLGS